MFSRSNFGWTKTRDVAVKKHSKGQGHSCGLGRGSHCLVSLVYLSMLELLHDRLSQLDVVKCSWLCWLCDWLNCCTSCHHCWVDDNVEPTTDAVVVQHCCRCHKLACLLGRVQQRTPRLVQAAEAGLQHPKCPLNDAARLAVCTVVSHLLLSGCSAQWCHQPWL